MIYEDFTFISHDASLKRMNALQALSDPSIVDVYAARPDFRGAMYQFLIGLVHSYFPIRDARQWRHQLKKPPTVPEWDEKIDQAHFLILNDAGKPAFLQDLELPVEDCNHISDLLIDAPGANTLKENKDFFVKRDRIQGLCPSCAGLALFTMQTNAPSGGKGHRVGLRGGGPLTTLLIPADPLPLWQTVMFNVTYDETVCLPDARVYPWLAATRTSERGKGTYPQDVDLRQVFWGQPRRMRFDPFSVVDGICSLCDIKTKIITRYATRPYGVNYEGAFRHPLTPYRQSKKDNEPALPIKGSRGGVSYKDWLGFTWSDESSNVVTARNVRLFSDYHIQVPTRLWCFGFDMDNMKARCWYEHVYPVFDVADDEQRLRLLTWTQTLVSCANDANATLLQSLKKAWKGLPKKADLSFLERDFWNLTEQDFFDHVRSLCDLRDGADEPNAIYSTWLKQLRRAVFGLFDRWALSGDVEFRDLSNVAKARIELGYWLERSKSWRETKQRLKSAKKDVSP